MKHIFVSSFIFFATLNITNALKITEVQFDPSGTDTDREWVEVYNDSASTIDFSKYKFFEAEVNHTLNSLSVATLDPGEYAVVIQDATKFFADYPNFTGKAFTSSFSLLNTGETLAFKTSSGATADSYSYSPSTTGAGNGQSEQLVGTVWAKGAPSPGLANTSTIVNPVDPATTTATTTNNASSTIIIATVTATVTETIEVPKIVYVQKSYWPANEKIYVSAGPNKLTVTGAEVQFEGRVYDPETKQQFTTGDFNWSFGDGYSISGSRAAKHIYKFPGEYTAVFQASSAGRYEEDRVYVKVVNPEIVLRMGRENDLDFVEITNNYNEELKLDDFLLTQLDQNGLVLKRFALPKGFSILPKRGIKIDLSLTQFVGPIVAIGLNYSSDIQLAKADNPNYLKDKTDLEKGINASSSSSQISVFLPGQQPKEMQTNELSTTSIVSSNSSSKVVSKTQKRKVVMQYRKVNISQDTNQTQTAVTSTSTPAKTILSKPQTGFWQSLKNLLNI